MRELRFSLNYIGLTVARSAPSIHDMSRMEFRIRHIQHTRIIISDKLKYHKEINYLPLLELIQSSGLQSLQSVRRSVDLMSHWHHDVNCCPSPLLNDTGTPFLNVSLSLQQSPPKQPKSISQSRKCHSYSERPLPLERLALPLPATLVDHHIDPSAPARVDSAATSTDYVCCFNSISKGQNLISCVRWSPACRDCREEGERECRDSPMERWNSVK